jgi:hypothetical protein
MRRLIRSASLTGYAEVAAAAGLDARRMMAEFHLPPAALREPELKVPVDAVRGLIEASAERSGIECFGLLMAEKRRLAHLGPLGLLMREQPTMHHALQAIGAIRQPHEPGDVPHARGAGEVVVLREELIVGGSGSIRQSTELVIGVGLPFIARAPRQGVQAAARVLRPRPARRSRRAPARLRGHGRVRP